MNAARKKAPAPRRKRVEPAEPKDFQEYLDMLQQPKWLQQILVAQDGFSALELAKVLSTYVRSIQRANEYLGRENTSMKIDLKRIREKQWNDLDEGIRESIIREHMSSGTQLRLDLAENTNASLRRELKRLQAALERGLCERG
jgi:hypothetical protein